jgi:DNA gyrase subunit A
VVTISNQGYVKYQPLSVYQAQRRGGKGKSATNVKDEDFIERLVITNTHDTLLCFSTFGKVYWIRAFELPTAVNRQSRGKPIVNILSLAPDERVNAMLPIKSFDKDQFVFMATQNGTVKKVSLEQFSRPRASGIRAIELEDDDALVGVNLTDGQQEIMLFSDAGKVIRFKESLVRAMGRTAKGVRGIKLAENQKVIALIVAEPEGSILTATENGFGKRTDIAEYRESGRGAQGVISIHVNERNGSVVRAIQVVDGDEVMLISDKGTLVRLRVKDISVIGRNTQGVRLIKLADSEQLVGMQRIEEDDIESNEEEQSQSDEE